MFILPARRIFYLKSTHVARYIKGNRSFFINAKHCTAKTNSADEEDDIPIKYSNSPASKWKAQYTRTGSKQERLWFEPYVIMSCTVAFFVYFCFIREENDIDTDLGQTLYNRISGLEEQQLELVLDYNTERGLETQPILDRLKEIERNKNKEL